MNRKYRKELPELKEIPDKIYGLYVIPDKEYNGFWGKNGYNSFDFIFEVTGKGNVGWKHWEGDVIELGNNIKIDSVKGTNYIRLYGQWRYLILDGWEVSHLNISLGERY